jgi:hypothetical protein
MNTASSAVFFIQLANKSTSDTSLEPKTLDAVGKIVEAAKLEEAWFGLPGKIKSVKQMMSVKSGADLADTMDDLYPDWQSMDLDELQKKADKVDAKGKASIAQTVLDAVQFLEDTDTHTFKAMEWKVKAASLVATLNKIIKTIEGIKNGMRENQEVEDVMNLKYMCSHMTYGYAQLLEEVINYNEFRKHWTISGNMYRGLRGTAEKLGVVSEHSTEGAKQLIAAFKGDGTSDNPGMAFYQLQGYYIDLGLTFENTRWTLERVKEKNPKTD